ncbi:hypothetical protein [Roseibium sp.]|uniref:hypothetical protein n=1 Tax=Roseibium sp. TaxID=1936156 RepID=UPI003B522C0A
MDPAEKKKLLDYSANPAPEGFRSWVEYEQKPVLTEFGQPVHDQNGAPKMKQVERPRWSTPDTVNWLRRWGRDMAQNACRDGWHMRLLDYVSYRHRLPSPDDIEALVLEQQRIDWSKPSQQVVEMRQRLKSDLLKPLELQAAE